MKKTITFILILVMILSLAACGSSSNTDNSSEPISSSSDMEIITRSGHPTYYDSVILSHEIWDDVERGKIHFADKTYGYDDSPILSMHANRNSDIINDISINFENFDQEGTITLEDALSITFSYMPFEIMERYYTYSGSKLIEPDESRKDSPSYYVISYRLTDEGKASYESKEHSYSGSIDVIIGVLGDSAQNVKIGFGTPRWMSSLTENQYHDSEWVYDFSSLR